MDWFCLYLDASLANSYFNYHQMKNSIKKTARIGGILYLIIIVGGLSIFFREAPYHAKAFLQYSRHLATSFTASEPSGISYSTSTVAGNL